MSRYITSLKIKLINIIKLHVRTYQKNCVNFFDNLSLCAHMFHVSTKFY